MKKVILLGVAATLLTGSVFAETEAERNRRITNDIGRDTFLSYDKQSYLQEQQNKLQREMQEGFNASRRMSQETDAIYQEVKRRNENIRELEK